MTVDTARPDIRFPDDFNLADYWLYDRLTEGRGDRVALRLGDRRWTYAEVAARSHALASALGAAGLDPGERVYIVLHDLPPFAWTIFATLTAGGVVTMGNPLALGADLARVIEYVGARVLVTTPAIADAIVPQLGPRARLLAILLVPDTGIDGDPEATATAGPALAASGRTWASLDRAIEAGAAAPRPRPRTHRDDHAIWLFTSGSTGTPKAAMHCHRDFAFSTEVYAKETIGYRAEDVTVSVARLFFGYATGTNLWFPFAVGATVCLFPERPTPESLVRAIERYRPTIVTNVPTMLAKLLDFDDERRSRGEPPIDLSCVRFHLSAGEALPPALLERFVTRFGGAVFDGIGSAEMFHIYCTNRPGDVRPGSLGRVVAGYSLAILPEDADGAGANPVPVGEIGVLWVRGDSVAQGYYQDRDKSWKTFHGHWCQTGDLFRIDERGYLWFSGRADDLLKVGGIFVAPLEVEECLCSHPAVSGAAVIGVQEAGLVKPKAVVAVRPEVRGLTADAAGRAALAAELQEHVRSRLSKYKYPRWVVFVDELPRNDRGKVDKKLLAAREAAGELAPVTG